MPPTKLIEEVISPAPVRTWRELLIGDQFALPSQTPEWTRAACTIGGYRDASVFVRYSSGLSVVLPMLERRLAPGIKQFGSMPFAWSMGGPVSVSVPSVDELRQLFLLASSRGGISTTVSANPLIYDVWAQAAPPGALTITKDWSLVQLDGGWPHVWESLFRPRARAKARRAVREGVTVKCDSSDSSVAIFHGLYAKSIERWAVREGEPAWLAQWRGRRRDPIEKFRAVAKAFGGNCKIWTAHLGDHPIAAIIVLTQGANALYWRGAMDESRVRQSGASHLLQRLAIQAACDSGCRFYHMGEAGSKSLSEFKRSFGASEYPFAEIRAERLPLTQGQALARAGVRRLLRLQDR